MAIEVSGCHLVLVICGQQPRPPGKGSGHGPRDVHLPQDLGHVATGRVIPGAPPRPASKGRTPPMAGPPSTVTGPGSRGGRRITRIRRRSLTCPVTRLQRRSRRQTPTRNPR